MTTETQFVAVKCVIRDYGRQTRESLGSLRSEHSTAANKVGKTRLMTRSQEA